MKCNWWPPLLLTAIVWIVFSRTLGSYFLADDFGEIAYVNRICNGELGLIWVNFSGNFMEVPSMSVWRPWLLMSLLFDFLIFKASPVGFYLTNLLSYNATVLLLYWLLRMLTRSAQPLRSMLAAFFAATLFAVSPLHCESVSWVVGRVDIVCCVFYLLCLCLFVRSENSKSKWLTVGSIASFWLAMWTKEMAIGASVMAFTITYLFSSRPLDWLYAIKRSLPLIGNTIIYFVLRYFALGTLLGGYTQGIGDSQAANALSRWTDIDTIGRLFFPFVHSLYEHNRGPATALALCYAVLAALCLLRVISLKIDFRWPLFLAVWTATCLAPLYKLWGLGYELEGARFCFFLTMPLATLMPVLLFIERRDRQSDAPIVCSLTKMFSHPSLEKNLTLVGMITLIATASILAKTANKTNLEWVHAGKDVLKFLDKTAVLNDAAGQAKEKLVVLGIPKRHGGAHMILNGSTLKKALCPPFRENDKSENILTFDPILFSEHFALDVTRFKNLLSQNVRVAYWNGSDMVPLKPDPPAPLPRLIVGSGAYSNSNESNENNQINENNENNKKIASNAYAHTGGRIKVADYAAGSVTVTAIKEGDGIAFSGLDLAPLSADFLTLDGKVITAPAGANKLKFASNFCSRDGELNDKNASTVLVSVSAGDKFHLSLPLSTNWQWYRQKIDTVFAQLPAGCTIEINNAALVEASAIQPAASIEGCPQSDEGVYQLPASKIYKLAIKLPVNKNVAKLRINITGENTFRDNFDDADRAIVDKITVPVSDIAVENGTLTAELKIRNPTHSGAFHQITVQALDKSGIKSGVESNALTVRSAR
jgi:hypothetical protein